MVEPAATGRYGEPQQALPERLVVSMEKDISAVVPRGPISLAVPPSDFETNRLAHRAMPTHIS